MLIYVNFTTLNKDFLSVFNDAHAIPKILPSPQMQVPSSDEVFSGFYGSGELVWIFHRVYSVFNNLTVATPRWLC